jgi:hypothetical protein
MYVVAESEFLAESELAYFSKSLMKTFQNSTTTTAAPIASRHSPASAVSSNTLPKKSSIRGYYELDRLKFTEPCTRKQHF